MILHSLIQSRHELAKRFTKTFQDQVKNDLVNYNAEDGWLSSFVSDSKLYMNVFKRYEIIIPMIFTTHEGMVSSMFDRVPDIMINQGGQEDEEKTKKVKASYEYLKHKCDLESFMNTAAWWYILTGFLSAHAGYVQKAKEVPAEDEMGEPMLGDDGEPIMITVYDEDDPEIYVDDPKYCFYSPESEYSVRADRVPYYTRTKLMTVEDVERTYGVRVEADSTVKDYKKDNTSTNDELQEGDLGRVKIVMYYGSLSEDIAEDLLEYGEEYDPDGWYYIVTTAKEILHLERTPNDMKTCTLLKWHGDPTKFFGFGIAKLLAPFQKEKSLRRSQQARYADVAAYPKILHSAETDIDEMAATDPRELPTIMFDGDKPEYMTPPDLSNVLIISDEKADEDAQRASGMLDTSQGSQQSNTVDTATGQAIFAEASEKRIRYAKKKFLQFYKESVVVLLKLAQLYWSEDKVVSLTDDDGKEEEIIVTAQDLSDIDFDKDIFIDAESLTINKDVIRAQAIELYDRVKDDPLVERKEVFKDVLRIGFDKRNPDKYIKDMELVPGTKLVNPETGEQYEVDKTGEVILAQADNELAQSEGGDVPMSESGIMGGAQQL